MLEMVKAKAILNKCAEGDCFTLEGKDINSAAGATWIKHGHLSCTSNIKWDKNVNS